MKDLPAGEWTQLSTEVSDKNGRVTYTLPDDKALGYGMYPVKMVVRYVIITNYFLLFPVNYNNYRAT
jgi:5-hydroxyisourate hydrolase-like protein (transthyretin family)